jgi:hypothetical protein
MTEALVLLGQMNGVTKVSLEPQTVHVSMHTKGFLMDTNSSGYKRIIAIVIAGILVGSILPWGVNYNVHTITPGVMRGTDCEACIALFLVTIVMMVISLFVPKQRIWLWLGLILALLSTVLHIIIGGNNNNTMIGWWLTLLSFLLGIGILIAAISQKKN